MARFHSMSLLLGLALAWTKYHASKALSIGSISGRCRPGAVIPFHKTTTIRMSPFYWSSLPTLLSRPPHGTTILWMSTSINVEELEQKIKAKGDEIRQLKADGIDKVTLAPHIEELKALKAQLPEQQDDQETKQEIKNEPPRQEKRKPAAASVKVEEMSESELRLTRLAKVEAMRQANVEPFEYTFDVNRSAAQLAEEYEGRLGNGEEDEASDVSVAGRIMTRRVFGKLAFFTLQDGSGTIQLQFDKARLGDSFNVSVVVPKNSRFADLCVYFLSNYFANLLKRVSKIGPTVGILLECGGRFVAPIRAS